MKDPNITVCPVMQQRDRHIKLWVGGGGRGALAQSELGLGVGVKFCQREKEGKSDRVANCPLQTNW